MINPTHRLKKFVKYSGNEKPADFHVTEERGWLGSSVTDCNGVEIFEGDIVKIYPIVQITEQPMHFLAAVVFDESAFTLDKKELLTEIPSSHLEVIGHIATEESNDNRT